MTLWQIFGRREEDHSLRQRMGDEWSDHHGWLVVGLGFAALIVAARSRALRHGVRMAWAVVQPILFAKAGSALVRWLRHRRF